MEVTANTILDRLDRGVRGVGDHRWIRQETRHPDAHAIHRALHTGMDYHADAVLASVALREQVSHARVCGVVEDGS